MANRRSGGERSLQPAGRSGGVTQFGRALAALNIDIICANTPQANGRVERMNKALQDRSSTSPLVSQGDVVENKRLGAVLAMIQSGQVERDKQRLVSKKISLREKQRRRQARALAGLPGAG